MLIFGPSLGATKGSILMTRAHHGVSVWRVKSILLGSELNDIQDINRDWFNGPSRYWQGQLEDLHFFMKSLYMRPPRRSQTKTSNSNRTPLVDRESKGGPDD
jgi:hypothetical protein